MNTIFSDFFSSIGLSLYAPHIFDLLSEGKIYPKNHSFFKTQKIIYSKLTGKHELFATEILFQLDSYQINGLLESLILNNDQKISINDFLIADRDLMIINHRISAYGREFSHLDMQCKKCKIKLNTELVFIKHIKNKFLTLDPCINNTNTFEFKNKKQTHTIMFRFPTVQIGQYFETLKEHYKKVPIKEWIEQLILRVNDAEGTENVLEALKNEPMLFKELKQYIEKENPQQYFITNDIICHNCKTDNTIKSNIGIELLPFRLNEFKQSITEEFIVMMKELKTPIEQVLQLPTEERKNIIKKFIDMNKPKEQQTIKGGGPTP